MNKKLIIEEGTNFGKWKIISNETIFKNNLTHWKCACTCGVEEYVPLNNLMNGSSTQCNSCSAISTGLKKRTGYMDITGTYWSILRTNINRLGKFFNIRIEEAWDIYLKQNKKCFYSGVDLFFNGYDSIIDELSNAKLILIDPDGEYEKDNVRWVSIEIAKMKNSLSEKEFIKIVKSINNYWNIDLSYKNDDGNLVFTEKYHLQRGYCCKSVNGCKHCPY